MILQKAGLSAEQQRVVDHDLVRPGIVDAGAGTGKTFTIVERVAALHESGRCSADKILLLTFARKAAAELRARITRRLGENAPTCSTFHAFAWSILSAHAYDIGLSPDSTVIEDVEARVEFKRAFDEFLEDAGAGPSGFPLRAFNCDEIRDDLFAIGQELREAGTSIEAFRTRALAAADKFARIGYRELRQPYPKREGYKTLDTIDDERLAREVCEEKQRVEAAANILKRFDDRLAARHALTYADILIRAQTALRQNSSLRDELRERFQYCIVDEYQDTDLGQHRFLQALFGDDLARVMVVGDVLQSIFAFRGAHPENIELFKRAPQATIYSLVKNRRSRQEILDFAQHAIAPAHEEAPQLLADRGPAGEQVVHVSSRWRPAGEPWVPAAEARKLEAAAVARRVVALLKSGVLVESNGTNEPLAPRHIAILSRTKANVAPVTEALLNAGVAFRLVGGVGFYDAPEIRDAVAWLRLLANPLDSSAVARAAASTAIEGPDGVLAGVAAGIQRDRTAFARRLLVEQLPEDGEQAAQARPIERKLRKLLDDLASYAALPLHTALRAVLDLTGIERHYQGSAEPRAEQALANLAKLEALARSFAQDTPGAQPADFVSFIDELERIDFDEREADIPASDAVTITTIHSAKGLEWPFVFVLSVWPQLNKHNRLRYDDASGALLYAEGPDGSPSFHYRIVKENADEDGIAPRKDGDADKDPEERRLFYVAVTRARDRLFLSGVRMKPSKDNADGRPHEYLGRAYDWLRRRKWHEDEEVPADASLFAKARTNRGSVERAPAMVQIARREAALAAPLSYSIVARFERCPRQATYKRALHLPETGGLNRRRAMYRLIEDVSGDGDRSPEDSLLGAGEYGQVLHKALELWARERRQEKTIQTARTYLREAADQLGLAPSKKQQADAEQAMEDVVRALGMWVPKRIEAPFTLDFGLEDKPLLVSGYIDLLARDEDGRRCLLDYKTGDVKADHSLQLALYRLAARDVYAFEVERCYIAHIDGKKFALESVEPVSDEDLRHRIVAVRDGLLSQDVTAKPGPWCATCGYRAAPCQDFAK